MNHLSADQVASMLEGGGVDTLAEDDARAHLESCADCLAWVGTVVRSARPPLPTHIGRYEVKALLGAGAMGQVYDAFDPELERGVAIKRLHHTPTAEHRLRLQREAQATANLRHPHLVTVHDLGEDAQGMYFVMQRVEGVTLAAWLQLRERHWREVLVVFVQAGEGLAAAHRAGLVHRDFKPQNVLVTSAGHPFVTDFGLARIEEGDGSAASQDASAFRTGSGTLLGTPAYMAPEQQRGERAGPRSDQFSFCVALVEALTGERPVAGGKVPLRPGLARVLEQGLASDPAQRFASMDGLLAELRKASGRCARVSRWAAVLFAVSTVALGGYLFAAYRAADCERRPATLKTLWDADSRRGVEKTLGAVADIAAPRTFAAVDAAFRAYLVEDARVRALACQPRAPEALRTRRLGCLARHLGQAEALRDVFAAADASVVKKAVSASESLLSLDECAITAVLLAEPAPRRTGEDRDRVQALQPLLARTRAAFSANLSAKALANATELVKQATPLGDDPLAVEALLLLGDTQLEQRHLDEGLATLRRAVLLGEAAGADALRAEALLAEARGLGGLGKLEETMARVDESAAILRRITASPRLQARFLVTRMLALNWTHRIPESVTVGQELLAYELARGGERSNAAGSAHANLGSVLMTAARYDEARSELERARDIFEGLYGEHHDVVAKLYGSLAEMEMRRFRPDRAYPLAQKARTLLAERYGAGSPVLEGTLYVLGNARALLGHSPEQVLPLLDEAERSSLRSGKPGPNTAAIVISRARYLADRGEWSAANPLFVRACATIRAVAASGGNNESCLVDYADSALDNGQTALARKLLAQVPPGSLKEDVQADRSLSVQRARLKIQGPALGQARVELAALHAGALADPTFEVVERAIIELELAEAWASGPSGDVVQARRFAADALTVFAARGLHFPEARAAALERRLR